MTIKGLCKDCSNFKPNGGYTSFEVIYNLGAPKKLGYCAITGELKNELCGCNSSFSSEATATQKVHTK